MQSAFFFWDRWLLLSACSCVTLLARHKHSNGKLPLILPSQSYCILSANLVVTGIFVYLGIKPMTSHMPGQHTSTLLLSKSPSPCYQFLMLAIPVGMQWHHRVFIICISLKPMSRFHKVSIETVPLLGAGNLVQWITICHICHESKQWPEFTFPETHTSGGCSSPPVIPVFEEGDCRSKMAC